MNLRRLQELVRDKEAWRATVHGVGHNWATELNWTDYESHSSANLLVLEYLC